MPNDKEILEQFAALTAKFDAVIEALKPVEEEEIDPRIEKAEAILRKTLKDNFPEEKLKEMKLDALSLACELKEHFKPDTNLDNPPVGTGKKKLEADAKKLEEYGIPASLNKKKVKEGT